MRGDKGAEQGTEDKGQETPQWISYALQYVTDGVGCQRNPVS
jgi:hypothetical protein